MNLEDLGYNDELERFRIENGLDSFEVGRVTAEYRERYNVRTVDGELEAEITGNIRFTANSREDFPAVGDWVALTAFDSDFAVIHKVLPRFSLIKRQAVGQSGEVQIIAANIDYAFLVQSVDRDFNINRLERYLTLCNQSKVKPLIVLSKTDLINEGEINILITKIKERIKKIPVISISNKSGKGYETIKDFIEKGKTYCLLGSSGVGKSTLINNLCGKAIMRTDDISQSTGKGKHITSHREMVFVENGGILIDNPGMREVGIADNANGLKITFDTIITLSMGCRFKDCTHTVEAGCRVIEAMESGEIDRSSYDNYLKMVRERTHFELSVIEKHKKEREFGKMLKNYKKDIKNNRF